MEEELHQSGNNVQQMVPIHRSHLVTIITDKQVEY